MALVAMADYPTLLKANKIPTPAKSWRIADVNATISDAEGGRTLIWLFFRYKKKYIYIIKKIKETVRNVALISFEDG